jgi:8-oxo-dGTP diphosphatase
MEKYIKYMFIVPQKAAIKDGNKYLILKRSPTSQTYPDCWDFPGGKMEKGEDVAKGLEREVKEETGLKIKVIKPVFTFGEELFKTPHVYID